jgi:hypothetical protein
MFSECQSVSHKNRLLFSQDVFACLLFMEDLRCEWVTPNKKSTIAASRTPGDCDVDAAWGNTADPYAMQYLMGASKCWMICCSSSDVVRVVVESIDGGGCDVAGANGEMPVCSVRRCHGLVGMWTPRPAMVRIGADVSWNRMRILGMDMIMLAISLLM